MQKEHITVHCFCLLLCLEQVCVGGKESPGVPTSSLIQTFSNITFSMIYDLLTNRARLRATSRNRFQTSFHLTPYNLYSTHPVHSCPTHPYRAFQGAGYFGSCSSETEICFWVDIEKWRFCRCNVGSTGRDSYNFKGNAFNSLLFPGAQQLLTQCLLVGGSLI